MDSGDKDPIIAQENMIKLLNWKDNREIFWTEHVVIEDTVQPPPSYTTDEIAEEHCEEETEQTSSISDMAFILDPDPDSELEMEN